MAGTGLPRGNIKDCNIYALTLTPTSVAPNTAAEQTFTFTGLGTTDWVVLIKPTAQAGLGIVGSRCSASNTLAITFGNFTSATITPTAAEIYTMLKMGSAYQPLQTAI
ncbi:MAG TPA: hypothetical protein VMS08_06280 [Candidatus Saccharimonadia bacterium]|nr:hypothetical protein [Candidatus Saccharimonadia bacterium]